MPRVDVLRFFAVTICPAGFSDLGELSRFSVEATLNMIGGLWSYVSNNQSPAIPRYGYFQNV
jgi:hypothetical protein